MDVRLTLLARLGFLKLCENLFLQHISICLFLRMTIRLSYFLREIDPFE